MSEVLPTCWSKLVPIVGAVVAFSGGDAGAADIPVSGVFGSSDLACRAYVAGGTKSIESGNGTEGLVVGPSELVGLEWGCRADTVFGASATLTCSGEGDAWTETATFQEDGDKLILTIGDDPPEALHRCASPGS